jgi:chromosome segregation ATPase
MSTPLPPQPPQKTCLERAIIVFVRLLFALIFGIAIGAGIYFGATLLYGQYLTLTQDYEARISALENQQSETEQIVSDRLADFQTRLETLEILGDTQKESLADLEGRIDSHEEFLSYQATVVMGQQVTQEGIQDTILALQTQIGVLESDLAAVQTALTGFDEDLTALETTVESYDESIAAVNEIVASGGARLTALQHQMVFLQAMELLTRARLNLVQGNVSLAQNDINTASALLSQLLPELPPYQVDYVNETILRLEATLEALPAAPLTASDQLESAWQMLSAGLPSEAEAQTNVVESSQGSTPTPTATTEVTATPTPFVEVTLTPTP